MPEIWFPHLGIEIEKLDNIAFKIFELDIYWYGITMFLGIFFGISLMIYEAKKTGQDIDFYYDFLTISVITSILSARLYYVIFSWDNYKNDFWGIFALRDGGIAIYGAIIGAIITISIFCKRKNVSLLKVLDTCCSGLILGQIIGRWGNFINREAYGGYTDSLFAMRYLKEQSKSVTQSVAENSVIVNGFEYIQVHPTFLYESVWNIGILIILSMFKKHKKFDGEVASIYLIGYGIGRFWVESLRTDALLIGNTGLAISQVVAVISVLIGTIFIIAKRTTKSPDTQ